jgi:hypothetical protein
MIKLLLATGPQSKTSIADPGCLSWTPDPKFFHPGFRIRIKEFKYLTQKIVSKLSELWFGLFIPDPDTADFYPSRIPDPGMKKAPDTDPQHCPKLSIFQFFFLKRECNSLKELRSTHRCSLTQELSIVSKLIISALVYRLCLHIHVNKIK